MISAKRLIKLAKNWQKMAAIRRKRITLPRSTEDADIKSCSSSSVVEKGHFVVYSVDQKRFVLPLEYLKNEIVMELFNLAEEEFGLPGNGLLILPCDATFMECVIALIKRKPSKDMEKALPLSVARGRSSSSYLYQQETSQQMPIWISWILTGKMQPYPTLQFKAFSTESMTTRTSAVSNLLKPLTDRSITCGLYYDAWSCTWPVVPKPNKFDVEKKIGPLTITFHTCPTGDVPNDRSNFRTTRFCFPVVPTLSCFIQRTALGTFVFIYSPNLCFFISAAQQKLFSFLRFLHSLSSLVLKYSPLFYKGNKMISAKKLIKLARNGKNWLQLREKESHSREPLGMLTQTDATYHQLSRKYSADEMRFVLPLEYLKTEMVMELVKLAEEEFGLPSNGHLTMPCDAAYMEYAIGLIKGKASKEMETALLMSVVSGRCSSSSYIYPQETNRQLPMRGF
ncbi:uncharacterized protein LOC111281699 [Durio zibethinus]|uniref:Uncharacterized protein LOC111281699 n=1 Tax=Durio zibethinus TaxID=66656 RepID=A0A6P5XA07_DURZI|nr:uncharacterized protein LOC111281699 [Durio zibethinus]